MTDEQRIQSLEQTVRKVRTLAAIGIIAALAMSVVAVVAALRSPSSLTIGHVTIDGEKVEVVASDRSKGARLDVNGVFAQDPMGASMLNGHNVEIRGRAHTITMWIEEAAPKNGTTSTFPGKALFSMSSSSTDHVFDVEVKDDGTETVVTRR